MRRIVKWIKQKKNGMTYSQPWIGYNYRNKNGTPDFHREVSLKDLPKEQVDQIDAVLRGGGELSGELGEVEFLGSVGVGAFWAAYCIAEELGIIEQIGRLEETFQFPALCMILDRVVAPLPHSKLSLWESLPGSALARVVAPGGAEVQLHEVYQTLEALYGAQKQIQQALYGKRDTVDSMYLYDITSSYFEGENCPLATFGYNRDGKKGKLQIVIGLLTDSTGRPLAIEVFCGNTSDQTTVMDKIDDMRRDFGIDEMVFIGDRGMVTAARRKDLEDEKYAAVKYISALTRDEFFGFLDDQNHPLQLTLFDREKLVEVSHEGIRYVLSFNPQKEQEDRQTRLRLIEKTRQKLEMIERNVKDGHWKAEKVIAKRLHAWVNKWKMARFFDVDYGKGHFSFSQNEEEIKKYEAIDGFYVITSDVIEEKLETAELRSRYKSLIQVEQAFRTMKTTDLFVRPIRHWNPDRVRGHIFMCMLAYLVVWKARQLFADFISPAPVDEDPSQADCHSLRIIWERLNQWVQIGTIKVNGQTRDQLSPLSAQAKKILKAAGASLTKSRKEQLMIVG
jgi:hypothetical protein